MSSFVTTEGRRKRGSYRCSKCGMPKKGHTCMDNSDILFSLPDSADTPPPSQSTSPKTTPKSLKKSDDSRASNTSSSTTAFTPPLQLVGVQQTGILPPGVMVPFANNSSNLVGPIQQQHQQQGQLYQSSMNPNPSESLEVGMGGGPQLDPPFPPGIAPFLPHPSLSQLQFSPDQLIYEIHKLRQENHQLRTDLANYEKLLIAHNIPLLPSVAAQSNTPQIPLLPPEAMASIKLSNVPPHILPPGQMLQSNISTPRPTSSVHPRSPEAHHDDKQSMLDGVHSAILSPPKRQKLQESVTGMEQYQVVYPPVGPGQLPPAMTSNPFAGIAQGSFPLQIVTMPPGHTGPTPPGGATGPY